MRAFDLHCDTLTAAYDRGLPLCGSGLQYDIAALPADRCGCQTFAIFTPDSLHGAAALDYFERVYAYSRRQFAASPGRLQPARTAAEVLSAAEGGRIAAFCSVENAASLGGDIANVQRFAELGIRMLTLTWNAENELAGGAHSAGSLTAFGRGVIAELERCGIALDVSHLNAESFWQAERAARLPFIASHSDSRALCDHTRNLTDDQFRAIAERGGLVGLNFYPVFLSPSGTAVFDDLLRHIEHFLVLGGERVLALGSDFDGAAMPDFLSGAPALDNLYLTMLQSALGKTLVDDIFFGNALAFFKKTEENL